MTMTLRTFLDQCLASPAPVCTMHSSAIVCRDSFAKATDSDSARYWARRCVAYTHGILSERYAEVVKLTSA